MKYEVRMIMQAKDHPYLAELSSQNDYWGNIRIVVMDERMNTIEEIVDTDWDVKPLIKWFMDNKFCLMNEELPINNDSTKSIALLISEFYENIDPEKDDEIDKMFAYRERHGLRFALMFKG